MPELPEVETVVRGLRLSLPGRSLSKCASARRTSWRIPQRLRNAFPECGLQTLRAWANSFASGSSRRCRAHECSSLSPLLPHHSSWNDGPLTVIAFRRIRRAAHARFFCSRRWPRAALHGHPPLWPHAPRPGIGAGGIHGAIWAKSRWRSARKNFAEILDRGALASRRCCSTKGSCAASAISMRTRACSARACIRRASRKPDEEATPGAAPRSARGSGRSHPFPRLLVSDYVDSEGQSRRIPAAAPRLSARWEAVLSLQGKNPPLIVAGRSSHFCPHCQPAPRSRRRSKRA